MLQLRFTGQKFPFFPEGCGFENSTGVCVDRQKSIYNDACLCVRIIFCLVIIFQKPRIDPIQLLNCLSVLLSPNGGIKSTDEVQRLAKLMNKFSKKLVSKCIYIQILKCTETELLGLFMGSGGWRLVHIWLTESIVARNWPLVKELLELLLLCPVDIDRLKTNNCPKLVKELSKDENNYVISALASKLVEQWLKTVKGETVIPVRISDIPQITSEPKVSETIPAQNVKCEIISDSESSHKDTSDVEIRENKTISTETTANAVVNNDIIDISLKEEEKDSEIVPVLKISLKDESKETPQEIEKEDKSSIDISLSSKEKPKDKHSHKVKEKSHSRSSKSSSSSSNHSSKHHSSSEKHKSSSSSSHHSSKDRSKDKEKRSSSSKSKSEGSNRKSDDKSSSSSKSKDDKKHSSSEKAKNKDKYKDENKDKGKEDKKEKSREKDVNSAKSSTEKSKDTSPPPIQKLKKIPKLSDVKKEKPSISIEVRKQDGPKPKTVKTFHSKFRKHGLEEEVKPPPSRATLLNKKPPPVLPPTVPVPKRPSPVHNESPPEKKPKNSETVEKPGAIKLIPPKPKPMMLLESDMFMDALNASATTKKEPKKRKRRTSGSKDGQATNEGSPPQTPTTVSSPSSEKSVPPRFYQDTLDSEENKDKTSAKTSTPDSKDKEAVEIDDVEPHTLTVNGLKGVLCYHKKKGPKKSIKWKPDCELEEIQYFELDETERVNVTKTFTDMKYLERIHEREAFQKARNLINDDVMEEKTNWRPLIPIDCEGQVLVEHGKNSKEKDIQAIRQKGTLQPLYFHKSMIPDSPLEPDAEAHPYVEPTIIPLEDVTGNQDNISDFRNMPWPEPKGNAPPPSNLNMQTMFPPTIPQFTSGFPGAQFPGFQAPGMVPGDWPNSVPPLMPNGMPGPLPPAAMAPGAIPPGGLPPGMMVPSDNMMMNPEMFGNPNPIFPGPPEAFNMQQNMFPMDFNMSGPPGPDGFSGAGNFRGAMRGRGSPGHWRGKTAGNWEGPQRGRGAHNRRGRKAMCMYFQQKGSCRQGDNCSFLHPGVNCPY